MRLAAGLAAMVLVGVCAPAPAAADPSSTVPPSAIDKLMFTQREAERVMGVDLPENSRQSSPFAVDTDRPDCGSIVLASVLSYDRSGYTAAHSQALWDHEGWYTLVDQTVAVFNTEDDAREFARTETDLWRNCENQTIKVSELATDGSYVESTVEARGISQVDNVLAVSYGRTDAAFASCQHVLLAERNVAVDIRTCSTVSKSVGERAFKLMEIVGPRIWGV